MEEVFTDSSLMPFGIHKGSKLIDVPAHHLIWLYENNRAGRLKQYIENNLEVLKLQLKQQNKNRR